MFRILFVRDGSKFFRYLYFNDEVIWIGLGK